MKNSFPLLPCTKNAGARLISELTCLHPSLLNHSCGAKLVDDQCANYPKQITNDLVEDALDRGSATQKTQAISIPGSVLQMEEPARVARAQESAPGLASTAPTEGG
jgi:hypothetical protein